MKIDETELQIIPGIGKSIAKDLNDLGIYKISDLRSRDPEKLYEDLMKLRGTKIDRCLLYVFREAVYYASNNIHEAELLKWWNWKDRK